MIFIDCLKNDTTFCFQVKCDTKDGHIFDGVFWSYLDDISRCAICQDLRVLKSEKHQIIKTQNGGISLKNVTEITCSCQKKTKKGTTTLIKSSPTSSQKPNDHYFVKTPLKRTLHDSFEVCSYFFMRS